MMRVRYRMAAEVPGACTHAPRFRVLLATLDHVCGPVPGLQVCYRKR